jgi:hypothetical protein
VLTPTRVTPAHRFIGLIQVFGAGLGGVYVAALALHLGIDTFFSWMGLLIVGFLAFVCTAGVLLLKGRQLGESLSIIAQVLQVPQIAVGPVAYELQAGPQLTIYFTHHGVTAWLGILSSVRLWRSDETQGLSLGLNLVALAILVALIALPSPGMHVAKEQTSPESAPSAAA